jgi:hypothetical protein
MGGDEPHRGAFGASCRRKVRSDFRRARVFALHRILPTDNDRSLRAHDLDLLASDRVGRTIADADFHVMPASPLDDAVVLGPEDRALRSNISQIIAPDDRQAPKRDEQR